MSKIGTLTDESNEIYLHGKNRNWTYAEYDEAMERWVEATKRGDKDADLILLEIPADPGYVMAKKVLFGKEAVLETGWDLTEANLQFGEGWLDK